MHRKRRLLRRFSTPVSKEATIEPDPCLVVKSISLTQVDNTINVDENVLSNVNIVISKEGEPLRKRSARPKSIRLEKDEPSKKESRLTRSRSCSMSVVAPLEYTVEVPVVKAGHNGIIPAKLNGVKREKTDIKYFNGTYYALTTYGLDKIVFSMIEEKIHYELCLPRRSINPEVMSFGVGSYCCYILYQTDQEKLLTIFSYEKESSWIYEIEENGICHIQTVDEEDRIFFISEKKIFSVSVLGTVRLEKSILLEEKISGGMISPKMISKTKLMLICGNYDTCIVIDTNTGTLLKRIKKRGVKIMLCESNGELIALSTLNGLLLCEIHTDICMNIPLKIATTTMQFKDQDIIFGDVNGTISIANIEGDLKILKENRNDIQCINDFSQAIKRICIRDNMIIALSNTKADKILFKGSSIIIKERKFKTNITAACLFVNGSKGNNIDIFHSKHSKIYRKSITRFKKFDKKCI